MHGGILARAFVEIKERLSESGFSRGVLTIGIKRAALWAVRVGGGLRSGLVRGMAWHLAGSPWAKTV